MSDRDDLHTICYFPKHDHEGKSVQDHAARPEFMRRILLRILPDQFDCPIKLIEKSLGSPGAETSGCESPEFGNLTGSGCCGCTSPECSRKMLSGLAIYHAAARRRELKYAQRPSFCGGYCKMSRKCPAPMLAGCVISVTPGTIVPVG